MAVNEAQEMVEVTIDGITTQVPKGTLVIEAARRVGVMIPHFCYHPKLAPDANCRMCLVEIEKMPKLQTSCSMPVAPGMVVRSSVPNVKQARQSVLELILANHPLDCPVCDQGGRCDLQDLSHQYTPTTSSFHELKRVFPKRYFGPLIETQMNRCVTCMRCVRYCDEVMDVKALAASQRGTLTEIVAFGGHELDCEYCGGCVQICPVGALVSRLSMYEYRPWMLKRAETICGYCGDGCHITIQTKNNELIEVNSTFGAGRNNGDLCARGYFGLHASEHPDRLHTPKLRRDGEWVDVPWEEALERVANEFIRIKAAHGPDAIGGLITARCTNEDLYVFQKFMRLVVGTNQLDSSARYGQINAVQALRRVQGTHSWSVAYEDILSADAILLVGTNITETNPITGLKVKEAVKKNGAQLITLEALTSAVGPISNIALLASHHLPVTPDQFGAAVIGLVKAVMEEGMVDSELSSRSPEYVQAISEQIGRVAWSEIEGRTGLPPTSFKESARAFEKADRGVILVGQGVLRAPGGYGITVNLLDLLLLTGKLSRLGCGLAPLSEENNDQGAIEMGAVSEFLPGARDLNDTQGRKELASVWGQEVPAGNGRSLTQMFEDAKSGKLKAMLIVGENPVASLPPGEEVEQALGNLEFLACQELFLTETALLAHVVLPACSYAEKDGTFTNTEGHVQAVRKAIESLGESRPDWEIFSALSVGMGHPIEYENVKAIGKEIRSVIPGARTLGPSPVPPLPDVEQVNHYVQSGFREDLVSRYQLSERGGHGADSLILAVTQSLYHSGKFSTRAKGLLRVQDKGVLSMNPGDAERLGVEEGGGVKLSNAQEQIETPVTLRDRVPEGVIFFPEHFDEKIRRLFRMTLDPQTAVPYYKLTRVKVEKA
ncbi:MAG: NADH-quinone oxidoreductase subunit NuoG [Nitrospirota bacterium]|nr:MAG: NADH-quinone oxidoreductase subunit NuoG [Nitrospirota bacterium]